MGIYPLLLVLGPCVVEGEDEVVALAQRLKRAVYTLNSDFVFKASFDKANRMSLGSFRGPGIEEGLRALEAVKQETGCQVLTDIHEPWQAERVAEVADWLQVPAMLCRQTDLVVAAGRTGKPVNIKKGQFMAPEDMAHIAEKAVESGAREVWLCERGTTFGYRDLVVDMRSIPKMKALGFPVMVDATHAVQKPGAAGGKSGGERAMVPTLARAGVAAGADGVFMEVHPDPDRALSDGPNSLRLEDLEAELVKLLAIRRALS